MPFSLGRTTVILYRRSTTELAVPPTAEYSKIPFFVFKDGSEFHTKARTQRECQDICSGRTQPARLSCRSAEFAKLCLVATLRCRLQFLQLVRQKDAVSDISASIVLQRRLHFLLQEGLVRQHTFSTHLSALSPPVPPGHTAVRDPCCSLRSQFRRRLP